MIPEPVRLERRRRCDCSAREGELHQSSCAVWPRPRVLYWWLSGKAYEEIARDRGEKWDRIFSLLVRVRHPVLWLQRPAKPEPDQLEIHTIPVPNGWSVEQAWEAISRGDRLTDPEPSWANVEVKNGQLVRVLPLD